MIVRYKVLTRTKAREFVENLDKVKRARVDRYYDLFEEYGPLLPSRYLKKISHNVWELRPGNVRLFLTIKGNVGIVVHGIHKKSQKTLKKDLEIARKRAGEE